MDAHKGMVTHRKIHKYWSHMENGDKRSSGGTDPGHAFLGDLQLLDADTIFLNG